VGKILVSGSSTSGTLCMPFGCHLSWRHIPREGGGGGFVESNICSDANIDHREARRACSKVDPDAAAGTDESDSHEHPRGIAAEEGCGGDKFPEVLGSEKGSCAEEHPAEIADAARLAAVDHRLLVSWCED
jgi:hypothetical protein